MDVRLVIKQRLEELGLEQRDLAAAARVTQSYISQLLTRKKAPPAVGRTALYQRMNAFLRLPKGQLSSIVEAHRREELKKSLADPPAPLFREVRELLIRKCNPEKQAQLRGGFEKQSFGELERFVIQTLLNVTKRIAQDQLNNGHELPAPAHRRARSRRQRRASTLDFLHAGVFNVSPDHCSSFLDPLIDSWDIELNTFAMEITLNHRLAAPQLLRFQFVETASGLPRNEEPGFQEFIRSASLSGDATPEEIEFLKSLKFKQLRPTPLYYYRELQSLRDPLHFREYSPGPPDNQRTDGGAGKQLQPVSRKRPIPPSSANTAGPRATISAKPSAAPALRARRIASH